MSLCFTNLDSYSIPGALLPTSSLESPEEFLAADVAAAGGPKGAEDAA